MRPSQTARRPSSCLAAAVLVHAVDSFERGCFAAVAYAGAAMAWVVDSGKLKIRGSVLKSLGVALALVGAAASVVATIVAVDLSIV